VRLAGLAMRSVRRLREWVYTHVLRLPMAFFDRAITGQLVSRITNDTEQIRQLYQQVLFEVLQGAHGAVRRDRRHGLARLAADADRADC
jgi:ATP-binding cassette, subfamily B, multidrug efflux pump